MADEMPACGKYPGEVTLFTCVWRKQLLLCHAAIGPGPFPSLLDQYEICEVQPQGLLIAADEAKHLLPPARCSRSPAASPPLKAPVNANQLIFPTSRRGGLMEIQCDKM